MEIVPRAPGSAVSTAIEEDHLIGAAALVAEAVIGMRSICDLNLSHRGSTSLDRHDLGALRIRLS